MVIFIASDHAGFTAKTEIIDFLQNKNHTTVDCGTDNDRQSVDYPDFAKLMIDRMTAHGDKNALGVLICGSGVGMSMVANRSNNIRAVHCEGSQDVASLARKHNDANIICFGARVSDTNIMKTCLQVFIDTEFEKDERHIRRISKFS